MNNKTKLERIMPIYADFHDMGESISKIISRNKIV
jgi:hypothetical protein